MTFNARVLSNGCLFSLLPYTFAPPYLFIWADLDSAANEAEYQTAVLYLVNLRVTANNQKAIFYLSP